MHTHTHTHSCTHTHTYTHTHTHTRAHTHAHKHTLRTHKYVGLARTVYIRRTQPYYIYLIKTLQNIPIWFWPTLQIWTHTLALCRVPDDWSPDQEHGDSVEEVKKKVVCQLLNQGKWKWWLGTWNKGLIDVAFSCIHASRRVLAWTQVQGLTGPTQRVSACQCVCGFFLYTCFKACFGVNTGAWSSRSNTTCECVPMCLHAEKVQVILGCILVTLNYTRSYDT